MNTAGYSGTPLIKKLGITSTTRLLLLNEPAEYARLLDADITNQLITKKEIPDLVHLFAKNASTFFSEMKHLLKLCRKKPQIVIWVSWYKKSSGISTDLSENIIRDFALQNSLVDVKVCAVSEEWSGLKLVVPLAKR